MITIGKGFCDSDRLLIFIETKVKKASKKVRLPDTRCLFNMKIV